MTILDGIKFLPSPNHHTGRSLVTPGVTSKITDMVLHWMDGTLASCDAQFANPATEVSAHYGIEKTTVHQYVALADTAWHSGDWNENQRSIGIEHSAQPGRDASPATIATSVSVITALCRKYNISPDHIYPHKKFYATACPGTLPIADIIARVRAQLGYPTNPALTPQTQEQIMADLTITNPATKAATSAETAFSSIWAYAFLNYKMLIELGKAAGVNVDEAAIAASVVAGLSGPLKAAVTAAVVAGGSPEVIADAVVAHLATALKG